MNGESADKLQALQHDEVHINGLLDQIQAAHPDKNVRCEIHDETGKVQFWICQPGSMLDTGPRDKTKPIRHIGIT
jgi:hypothetical protein